MSEFKEIKCNINLERDIKSPYNLYGIFIFKGKREIKYNNL